MASKENPVAVWAAHGARNIEQLGGCGSEINPSKSNVQVAWLLARFGLTEERARLTAELAFHAGRRR